MVKQIIIVRKDLKISYGKFGAQVAHVFIAFLLKNDRKDIPLFDEWLKDGETKVICSARNKTNLLKAKIIAEGLGLKENKDFWIICDLCRTELKIEDYYEDGTGYTMTCIGFRPLKDDIVDKISKKFQLFRVEGDM